MKFGFSATRRLLTGAATCFTALCFAASLPRPCAAQEGGLTGSLTRAVESTPIKMDLPPLVDVKHFVCGQAPGLSSLNPFPVNIRVGAMLSPISKLAVGADVTLTSFHIAPGMSTRIDGDAILGANEGGSRTIFPITLDQLYNKSLPGGTGIYFGGGVGMFFGGQSRLGGKLVLGASIRQLGIEANLDFAGIGDPLFLLQARFGL